jgi:hypothetical protein
MVMGQNNGNGYPAKVDLQLDQQVQLRIIRPVKIGTNGKDPYYLYRVVDVQIGEEKSLFAEPSIHSIIEEKHLGIGSEFLLKRVQNGRKGSSNLELSILEKAPEPSRSADYKQLMKESLDAAVEVTQSILNVPWHSEDIQKIGVAMYLSTARNL